MNDNLSQCCKAAVLHDGKLPICSKCGKLDCHIENEAEPPEVKIDPLLIADQLTIDAVEALLKKSNFAGYIIFAVREDALSPSGIRSRLICHAPSDEHSLFMAACIATTIQDNVAKKVKTKIDSANVQHRN